jgi:CubicO group peptidase (beta-lactamase class C family)
MVVIILVITLFNTIAWSEQPVEFTDAWKGVEAVFVQGNKESNIIGSSLMFIHDGQILGRSFYGLADRGQQRPVDENTIYHWASITKTFTSIAIMQLRDRGLLSLDDPIIWYLPELRVVYNPYGNMEEITLRHLMTHSSGFRNPTWPWGGDKEWHPHEPKSWEQVVAMLPYTEIKFKPGSRYGYSNPGIIFLGRVIEILSGDDYEVYMDKNVLKPLQMYNSYFDITPYHLLKHRSNNYYIREDSLITNGLDFDTGVTVSNGGLNAPLGDMAKYLTFLMGSNNKDHNILKRSSLTEQWQIFLPVEESNGIKKSIGLSFFILEYNGLKLIGHTGGQKGFISFFYVHPESKTAAIAVFNTLDQPQKGPSNTRLLSEKLRNVFIEKMWPLFTEKH